MLAIILKALRNSRGSASVVAVLTIAVATLSVIVAVSVASGFRESLTDAVISTEGDYWLEYRDNSNLIPSAAKYDSQIVSRLYENGAEKVEGRISANVVALTYEGAFPLEFRSLSDVKGVVVSESLQSKLGDTLDIVSSMKIPLAFPVKVDSVFKCDIAEISGLVCYAPQDVVARFRGLNSDYVDGYVVWGSDIESLSYAICDQPLWIYESRDRFAGVFDWLNVIDGNVWLVVLIMITVSAVNMLAALLSTILENTKTIAVLKSIGMSMRDIRLGVVVKSLFLSAVGAIIGLVLALVICFLQFKFGIVRLSQEDYMLSTVPVSISFCTDFAVAVAAVALVSFFSVAATIPIANIKEDTILRYE